MLFHDITLSQGASTSYGRMAGAIGGIGLAGLVHGDGEAKADASLIEPSAVLEIERTPAALLITPPGGAEPSPSLYGAGWGVLLGGAVSWRGGGGGRRD